jgi:hypothetical protein
MSTTTTRRQTWSNRATWAALGLWGAIHVIGGASLLAASTTDGLDSLAPDAATAAPINPGDGAEAVLRFHALNIALGGFAVLVLTVWWARSQVRWRRDVALATAVALDIGLIAFLVGPGLLPASQGLIGPLLVVIAAAAIATTRPTTA